jgi:hypothetical protein
MIFEIERGSTRSHYVESSLWKRLCTCRETDCGMSEWRTGFKWIQEGGNKRRLENIF